MNDVCAHAISLRVAIVRSDGTESKSRILKIPYRFAIAAMARQSFQGWDAASVSRKAYCLATEMEQEPMRPKFNQSRMFTHETDFCGY